MVKYGKEFRNNQKSGWEDKYFDYKAHKNLIKVYCNSKEDFSSKSEDDINHELEKSSLKFEEELDKDIKKVYIFFANKERILYKKINESLHLKDDFPNFELNDFLNQYKELNELSQLSLDMSKFIFYNLKALIKILKKFDKKVITPQHKEYLIRINYIQSKLEEQNSDILYLLKFKMIDEINVILEDLINNLMKEFKSNKDRLIEEHDNEDENDNRLIEETPGFEEATNIIKTNHEQIKKNIKAIDQVSANVTKLFLPWKDFLRISSDVNSKFLQIQRDNSINDSSTTSNNRNPSIIQSLGFSKESKINILIVLLHGFLYMFSFSVIIPTYTSFDDLKEKRVYWGLLMMMAPIGTLFNYLYETFLFKRSTKRPIIFSCLGLIFGNLLYVLSPKIHVSLLFVGRFICGLFNLRTHNKMYIINFLLQKDVSFYLTMFHTSSTLGLGFGYIINCGFLFIESEDKLFNKSTIGSIFTIIFSFILLILTAIKFTEAHSKKFSITSMQMFGDGIFNDDDSVRNEMFEGEDMAKDIRKKTLILKDIDSKLGNFNRESNFDDTNLVAKSVNELTLKEEGGLHSLLNVFIVYLVIIFTTKFINESIFINSQIFMKQIIGFDVDELSWVTPLVLGGSCFLILLVELALSCKNVFITERNLVIILLVLILINNALFLVFHYLETKFYFIIATDTILASITEKYTAHLFLYIIPDKYTLCKMIHGNVFINILSMFSRILSSGLLIILAIKDFTEFNIFIYIVMTSLSFISLLLYIIFYSDIRIKAINRIIKSNPKDDIKIATEL